jgi:mRNA interferase RelE/StbE
MNVAFSKHFLKQLDKVNDPVLLKRIKTAILKAESAQSIQELSNIKKMSGYDDHFRIRIGDYRIGLKMESDNTLWFAAIAHRKDIYSLFP